MQCLFKDPEFDQLLQFYDDFPFLRMNFSPGSVIFTLPGNHFQRRTQAYHLIVDEIGPVLGNFFFPISEHYPQPNGDLIFTTKFQDDEATMRAIDIGINLGGVQYKAVYYKDIRPLHAYIEIKLTQVPVKKDEALVEGLERIFENYGKIAQIETRYTNGQSEGDITVILNKSGTYQPLPSQKFDLDVWGIHVPVTYSDVIPHFCDHCYELEHTTQNCPYNWKNKERNDCKGK